MISSIFAHSDYLGKALDASWIRNEVTANNISNIDTPNFKSSHVEFESALKDAIEGNNVGMKTTNIKHVNTDGKHISSIEPKIEKDTNTTMRMDGNNVDMEAQQLDMVKNVIYYNSLVQKLHGEFSRLRTAINEGK